MPLLYTAAAAGVSSCPVKVRNFGNVRLDAVSIKGGSASTCSMAVLVPGQIEYCTLKQDVTQDDFDNGTFVVAVTEAAAVPRGVNKELAINLDSAEVVQVDRIPAMDLSCSVKQGWVSAAGELARGCLLCCLPGAIAAGIPVC
jgi:hypothetical protein